MSPGQELQIIRESIDKINIHTTVPLNRVDRVDLDAQDGIDQTQSIADQVNEGHDIIETVEFILMYLKQKLK